MTRPVKIERGPFATIREARREMDALFAEHPMHTYETSLGVAQTDDGTGWVVRGSRRASPLETAA